MEYAVSCLFWNGETNNWVDNNFLTLSLGSGWDIATPKLTGLTQPDGPPAVANGFVPTLNALPVSHFRQLY